MLTRVRLDMATVLVIVLLVALTMVTGAVGGDELSRTDDRDADSGRLQPQQSGSEFGEGQ